MRVKIERAFFSVHNQTGLAEFAKFLHERGVELSATEKTARAFYSKSLPVKEVSLAECLFGGVSLAVFNFKPFAPKAKDNLAEVMEAIDIDGISALRRAATHCRRVLTLCDYLDYERVMDELKEQQGNTSSAFREYFAEKAFHYTGLYDVAVADYLIHRRDMMLKVQREAAREPAHAN